MSDKPNQSGEPEPGQPEPLWPADEAAQGPLDADFEPEPVYEPLPGIEETPLYNETDVLGTTGPVEIGQPTPESESVEPLPLEPEPESDAALAGAAAGAMGGMAAGGYGSRARVAARVRVRPRTQREISQVWGSVFFSVEQPSPRLVAVTAAARGEGVTQIATSLAMTGAASQGDARVCLVDCNMRHARVADLLGLQASPGLSDVLVGRARLDDAIHPVGVGEGERTLSVIPAGGDDPQPLGLLRSRQFKALLGTLRERFDHVVLDTPAANMYPDPQLVASLCDGAVLVVHASRTRRESVAEARKRLELARARLLGVVLNQRTYPIPGFLYRTF